MIYLAYILIALRLIPIGLQWIAHSKGNLGSLFFFLFSALSFASDVVSIFFSYYKWNTDYLFGGYQIGEVWMVTLLAIEIGNLKKRFKCSLLIFTVLLIALSIGFSVCFNISEVQDYISGTFKLYCVALLILSAVQYIKNAKMNSQFNVAPLLGLLGIFIFEALSIIPMITMQLQRQAQNPQTIIILYLFFVMVGNLTKDFLISYNAYLHLKKLDR